MCWQKAQDFRVTLGGAWLRAAFVTHSLEFETEI
jgi:hypothetical protein